ncbi:uncharacterized protein FOMMEDRAFT_167922 [Fomitiporia mediterranea MF3/22]|uniref:uncharacterized protein n=1 Tax=Fomitiporia mediterranea (strain MF3/22) TaxID=694068 RepID=UPI0004408893|nr:uncharacterized protein FOMMEDRAFT_167922 [Fomitiporia mediterranea MF3/22]EJD02753.1 hypothetical protein FOMMEDRAFT_167922 [Fomitiporia mediterranea MF3/22]
MLPRSAIARSNGLVTRRIVTRRPAGSTVRFQSTSSSSGASSSAYNASHAAAGVAGGATVALAGYVWYHTSGLKTALQTSKDIKSYLQTTRDNVVSKARETAKNPSQALSHLRGIAKSYSNFIPGASGYIDTTFDELDDLYGAHSGEMDSILKETTDELSKVANQGRADTATAAKVAEIVGNAVRRMQELGKKVGGDILDKSPMVKEKLGSGYEQLQSLAEKAGPEGRKALDEVQKQVKEIISRGKPDEEAIKKIRDHIQDKASSIRKRVESSDGTGILDKFESVGALFKNIPGVDEIIKKAPNSQEIIKLAEDQSEEAQNLAKETLTDVMAVLEEKGKKAKELTQRTKVEAEKQAKN